jgi:hypothetical protein
VSGVVVAWGWGYCMGGPGGSVGSDVAGAVAEGWSDLAVDHPGSLCWSDSLMGVVGRVAVLHWRWGARLVVGVAGVVLGRRGLGPVGLGA